MLVHHLYDESVIIRTVGNHTKSSIHSPYCSSDISTLSSLNTPKSVILSPNADDVLTPTAMKHSFVSSPCKQSAHITTSNAFKQEIEAKLKKIHQKRQEIKKTKTLKHNFKLS